MKGCPFPRFEVSAMLVRFSVENYLSFRERVELSMIASKKVRKHPGHVIKPTSIPGHPTFEASSALRGECFREE